MTSRAPNELQSTRAVVSRRGFLGGVSVGIAGSIAGGPAGAEPLADVPPREPGADLGAHSERSKFVKIDRIPEAAPGKRVTSLGLIITLFPEEQAEHQGRTESAPLDRLATRRHLPQTRRVPLRGHSQHWLSAGAFPTRYRYFELKGAESLRCGLSGELFRQRLQIGDNVLPVFLVLHGVYHPRAADELAGALEIFVHGRFVAGDVRPLHCRRVVTAGLRTALAAEDAGQ